jgi:hypothetical protein
MFLSVEEVRDYSIIAYCICGVIAFLLIAFFTMVLGTLSWMSMNYARGLLKNNVAPTVESVRQTSESVRGTVEFVSDYAVSPVVKTYGTMAGARAFISVLARFGRSRGRR